MWLCKMEGERAVFDDNTGQGTTATVGLHQMITTRREYRKYQRAKTGYGNAHADRVVSGADATPEISGRENVRAISQGNKLPEFGIYGSWGLVADSMNRVSQVFRETGANGE